MFWIIVPHCLPNTVSLGVRSLKIGVHWRRSRLPVFGGLPKTQARRKPDSGQMEPDAGQMEPDAGQMEPDAGQMEPDAGQT